MEYSFDHARKGGDLVLVACREDALHMNSLVDLTHLYLQGMVSWNTGKILQLASTAGMLPGPLQASFSPRSPSLFRVPRRLRRSFPAPRLFLSALSQALYLIGAT